MFSHLSGNDEIPHIGGFGREDLEHARIIHALASVALDNENSSLVKLGLNVLVATKYCQ